MNTSRLWRIAAAVAVLGTAGMARAVENEGTPGTGAVRVRASSPAEQARQVRGADRQPQQDRDAQELERGNTQGRG